MPDLVKTSTPGIYRRHRKGCGATGRCECPWVIAGRSGGRQFKETCNSFNEARERKAAHESGEIEPRSKAKFGDYFPELIESYSGLTSRGFSETTRPEYRRPIDVYAMPAWKGKRLSDIDRADVRRLFMTMRKDGKSTSVIKKLRVALSALFETAIEDELVRHNPAKGVRIPAPLTEEAEADERAKALTRHDLAALLAEMSPEWQLFFASLRMGAPTVATALGEAIADAVSVESTPSAQGGEILKVEISRPTHTQAFEAVLAAVEGAGYSMVEAEVGEIVDESVQGAMVGLLGGGTPGALMESPLFAMIGAALGWWVGREVGASARKLGAAYRYEFFSAAEWIYTEITREVEARSREAATDFRQTSLKLGRVVDCASRFGPTTAGP